MTGGSLERERGGEMRGKQEGKKKEEIVGCKDNDRKIEREKEKRDKNRETDTHKAKHKSTHKNEDGSER